MRATEAAKRIREELKGMGITARAVSVRSSSYSMGSSVSVTILDGSVCYSVVENIAEKYEEVRRDSFGEILSGGNMHVSVSVDSDVVKTSQAEEIGSGVWRYRGVVIREIDRWNYRIDDMRSRGDCYSLHAAMSVIYRESKPALSAGAVDETMLSQIFGD